MMTKNYYWFKSYLSLYLGIIWLFLFKSTMFLFAFENQLKSILEARDTSHHDFIENAEVNEPRSNAFNDPGTHPQIPYESKEKITLQLHPPGIPHRQLDPCQNGIKGEEVNFLLLWDHWKKKKKKRTALPWLRPARIRSYIMTEYRPQSGRPPKHVGPHQAPKRSGLICMISVGQSVPQMQSWLKSDVAQQLEGRDGGEWDGRPPSGPTLLWCSEDTSMEAAAAATLPN